MYYCYLYTKISGITLATLPPEALDSGSSREKYCYIIAESSKKSCSILLHTRFIILESRPADMSSLQLVAAALLPADSTPWTTIPLAPLQWQLYNYLNNGGQRDHLRKLNLNNPANNVRPQLFQMQF